METNTEELQAWQLVWRQGLVPQLSTAGLEGLLLALESFDPRVIQGSTTQPAPLQFNEREAVEFCCPLCYVLLDGRPPYAVSVGKMDERFFEVCCRTDQLMGEPAAVHYFLSAVDSWSREELRAKLIPEVRWALEQRRMEPAV